MSAKFPRGGGAGPFLARSLYANSKNPDNEPSLQDSTVCKRMSEYRVKSGNLGHQVVSDSVLFRFIF